MLAVGAATAEPPNVASKQAQAQQVLAEIQQIDASLEHVVEAYNAATVKLQATDRDLKVNRTALHVARFNLGRAQKTLSARMVSIYTSGEDSSTLAVLLGSTSIDDMMSRLETVSTITAQDTQVIGEVNSFRREIQQRQKRLETARADQAQAVATRVAERARITGTLQQRQSLLGSIRGEIAHLRAAEQARQLMMARQAQARVSASSNPIIPDAGAVVVSSSDPSLAPPSQYGDVVGIAMRYLGIPYVWGGSSPSGFDCSGFTSYVYGQMGVALPHYTGAQYGMGVAVSRDQLQPGDLVFFNGLGHEGIYIGADQFIHSPHSGDVVKISSMSESWYASTYVGARRITG